MIALAHFLIGALIGKSLDSIFLIIVFAFISHFVLDAIPHIDQGSFRKRKDWAAGTWFLVFLDVLVGAAIALYIALQFEFWPVVIGAAFAVLPDVISTVPWMFGFDKNNFYRKFQKFHEGIGFKMTRELVWLGVILEVAVILSILSILLFV